MELEDHPLYGKRKRKRQVCPNPLFLQWLTEWRDEAAEKGWKTQFVYGKAIKSLKKYPLPLATGKDCKMLEHFGDKTCKLIEGKLVEHITLYGRIVPPDLDDVPRRAPPKPTATKRPARPVASAVRSIPTIVGISDEEDCTVTPVPKKRARPRSKSGDREYVPSYRSGGYAVMLALYRDTQDGDQSCLTPGKHTHRLSVQKHIQSGKKKAVHIANKMPARRQLRLDRKDQGEIVLGTRETTTNKKQNVASEGIKDTSENKESTMSEMMEDTSNDKENMARERTDRPENNSETLALTSRETTSVEMPRQAPACNSTDIYFDLETTGLARTSSIIQMAAVRGREKFSCYVMPKKPISRKASELTYMRVCKGKMYHNRKLVKTVCLSNALHQFTAFLSRTLNNTLIGHNIHTYDCPVLMYALESCDQIITQQLMTHVGGFLDTRKLFRVIYPGLQSYSQESLVRSITCENYSAHNALDDVVALRKLVCFVDVDDEARKKASFTVEEVMDSHRRCKQVKLNFPSLKTMVDNSTITVNVAKSIAGNGVSYRNLLGVYRRNGRQGIEDVFTEVCKSTRVQGTRSNKDPNSRGNLSRTELIQKAQPLADKSFTIPDAGSRYTAWSSMGTLIKKALVVKESNPAKYSLTEAGCELAHKLEVVGAEGPVPADQRQSAPHRDVFSLDLPSRPPYQQSDLTMADSSGLEFTYIDDAGEAVQTKDKAEVLIDVDFGIGFLTYCNYHGLLTSGKHYKLDTSRPMGVKVFAHLHDNDAPEMAVGPAAPSRLPTLHMVDDDDYQIARPNQTQVTSGHRFPLPSSTTISSASGDSDISKKVKPRVRTKANKSASIKLSAAASRPQLLPLIEDISLPLALSRMVTPLSELQGSRSQEFPGSQESIRSISSASSVSSLPCPDFILTPGNFDIILCIDNQEFYGAGKNGSKTLLPDLMKNGVNCDLRKLQVGDLLWVAREKTATVSGINAVKGRELVLDYVVERKRMDDLVHSCIDGRLPDQKFRLKHCGINHAIFLIETYGSMQHFSIAEDRIKQTITNLQVIDGFQIKRTGSTKESVVYLTVMTRYIHSYYKNKTLYATSPDDLQGEGRISDAEHRLLTFEQFNQGSVKSKALTVREMFGKQLIQLNGMSAEKAKAITDKYPTPSHMLEAYDHCLSVKDRESLLGTIKSGKAMRNLGQSLSKQIYQLYCTPNTLT